MHLLLRFSTCPVSVSLRLRRHLLLFPQLRVEAVHGLL